MTINLDTENILNINAVKGRTLEIEIEVLVDDSPIDFSGLTIKMEVRRRSGGAVALTFTVGEGITISEEGTLILEKNIDISVGVYRYDLLLSDSDTAYNIMKGTFNVSDSITAL